MIESLRPAEWAAAAAERLTRALSPAIGARGRATFAGSGGSTPAPIYRVLADTPLDWWRVDVTLVDERYVPETDAASNAALVKSELLHGQAAAARFQPLFHAAVTVDRAAAEATRALATWPPLDAVLLGMGEDGHICSMFPTSPTLSSLLSPVAPPTVLGVPAGRDGTAPSMERLSMNLGFLRDAATVVLALTGSTKRAVFEAQAAGDPATAPIAALIAARAAVGAAPIQVLWTETAP